MRISELKHVANFVKRTVIDPDIPGRFQELIDVLNSNAQLQFNQSAQAITVEKSSLINGIKAIRPNTLTLNERRLLETFIDTNLMGDAGAERINQVFVDYSLDPMGAVNAFTELQTKYAGLAERVAEILGVLKPIDVAVIETDIEEGHAVLQITFRENATIGTVDQWHESANEWWKLVHAFGRLTDTTVDDAKILSFQQGSLVIEVSAPYLLIMAVGMAADRLLSVAERTLRFQKAIEEVKHLKLTNKKLEQELEKEAEAAEEKEIKQIAREVIEEVGKAKVAADEGETKAKGQAEVESALQISIKDLRLFLQNGGTVDVRLREKDRESERAKELLAVYGRIRALETRIEELKLLTDGKDGQE